jgi:hypothetical protein
MDPPQAILLHFLQLHPAGIKENGFPQEIRELFNPESLRTGGLYYTLHLMKEKGWVQTGGTSTYKITEPGKKALLRYNENLNRTKEKQDEEDKNLSLNIKYLESEIAKHKFDKILAVTSIIISLGAIAISIIALVR